ncbi:FKBP-type peptidyl-prolyl cis-trans isomerase [Aquimarina algiphila]|uniref:peptidylprolyl isomerase n=1 Tax=Aquimarina algiphila TaxID=2047982 RepID=A0A554VKM9_9FLAO|nr:hypothetical protein [Aquimarina algiphila]TSE08596.1 hypothetical protein FOF46_11620 [Aquimarina algiphila]
MNVRKYIFAIVLVVVSLYACKSDDDDEAAAAVPARDRAEQQVTDDAMLQEYLKTHFYKVEDVFINGDTTPEYQIVKLDTIEGANSGEPAIFDSDLLTTKKITSNDVEYNLYILNLNRGEGPQQPSFADSTLVTYKGELLFDDDNGFDSAVTPVWFNQVNLIEGWKEAVVDFKGTLSENFVENSDGTVSATGFGHMVIFIPSGLGYFNTSQPGIPSYSPLIFNIQLYKVNQADHDRDGIPSDLEDLDGDRIVADDNTDGDVSPNYLDTDDDGDGTLTRDEITVTDSNADGIITIDEITFYDDDGDGVSNHLDPDDRDVKNN